MSLCLSVLVIMLLNYSKITTNAKFNKMVTLTRYYNYILHTCILPILTKWYIPRFRRSAAQVQCIIVNCGTFTNMLSFAALEQPSGAAISSPRNRRNLKKTDKTQVFFRHSENSRSTCSQRLALRGVVSM